MAFPKMPTKVKHANCPLDILNENKEPHRGVETCGKSLMGFF